MSISQQISHNMEKSSWIRQMFEQGIAIELTDAARRWLAESGYDRQFGARPLRRTLQREIESPLSRQLLRGEIAPGGGVRVDVVDGKIHFSPAANQDSIMLNEPAVAESSDVSR